jgi:hypothetical protein
VSSETTKDPAARWTTERIAKLDRSAIETLRANALRQSVNVVVERCDEELLRRVPKRQRERKHQAPHSDDSVVVGYHVVCADDRGVTQLDNGCFRSGSWVIAEENVRRSLEYGAYLALHQTKADLSYRQGRILNYTRTPRVMIESESETKTEEGIEFLVQATDEPYVWVGAGAGEKGYRWADIKTHMPNAASEEGRES